VLLLAFVPFGLPVPPYNTIGLLSRTLPSAPHAGGFATGGPARIPRMDGGVCSSLRGDHLGVSTLAIAALTMAAILLMLRGDARLRGKPYITVALITQGVGWAVVATVLFRAPLFASVRYTAGIAEPGSPPGSSATAPTSSCTTAGSTSCASPECA